MSDSEKNKVTVEVHKRKYTVVGEESQEQIKMVASLVDQKMDEIQFSKPSFDTTQLAVLTALNTMNDYLKLKQDYDALVQKERKEDRK
ncbi:cell division protein ZapA [Alkalibacillus haloalkaliphilus]|uniref:Cell division protein ZapA n=1 Tax=Alkalibacillus haloalkaliphilus TaxID=94136 RepID=A0A511W434_9BACI|nr:cell division protein ZapA [Alkalibacillus haloalkaliphilus]MDV2581169.1 cell division protein ZapA [Alkalibacillus haloalkaliphilus]GEN45855.1 cell division protein ZapA [Alkalibacillus haloalkaliphilus]